MGIELLKSQENIKKSNELYGLFELNPIIGNGKRFLDQLNEDLIKKGWHDKNYNKFNESNYFKGTLKDFFDLQKINNVSKGAMIKVVLKIKNNIALDELNKINKEIREQEKNTKWLPLSYLELVINGKKTDNNFNNFSAWYEYENFYKNLTKDKRKFFKFNDDIVVIRQSPDAKKQAITEAVSNAIDATIDVKIGEKGLGIKQALAYLSDGGKIDVWSKQQNKTANMLGVKQGADNNYYVNLKRDKNNKQNKKESGTILSIDLGKKMTDERLTEIQEEIKYKFRFTPDIFIILNGKTINHYENIKDLDNNIVKRNEEAKKINIIIKNNKIVIEDCGVGMSAETLSKMFIPRSGTNLMKTENLNKPSDILLIKKSENRKNNSVKVFLSRQREILEDKEILEDEYLNISKRDILIDNSQFRVPEARQNIFVDANFLLGVKNACQQVIDSSQKKNEKIKIINTIVAYLEQEMKKKNLGDKQKNKEQNSHIIEAINDIKNNFSSIIDSLKKQYIILPNQVKWKNIGNNINNVIYINDGLFDFDPKELTNIEELPFIRGAKIYAIDMSEIPDDKDKFIEYNGIYLFDKKIIDKYIRENDSMKKATLQELIELTLNPVVTSYDKRETYSRRKIKIAEMDDKQENENKNLDVKFGIFQDLLIGRFAEYKNCRMVKKMPDGNIGISCNKGFLVLDEYNDIIIEKSILGKNYNFRTVEVLENGNIVAGGGSGFIMFDQNGQKIEGSEISNMDSCDDMIILKNENIAVRFSGGFAMVNQDGQEIDNSRIDTLDFCYEIKVVKNENIAVRFFKGFVMFDQNGQKIEGSEISNMDSCDDMIILKNGNIAIGFSEGFAMVNQNGQKIEGSEIEYAGDFNGMNIMKNGNIMVSFNEGFVMFDQNGQKIEGSETKEKVGESYYNMEVLQNGNIAIGLQNGIVVVDQNGQKIEGGEIKNVEYCSNIATLQNGNIVVVLDDEFVVLDQNGKKIMSSKIGKIKNAFIEVLKSGNIIISSEDNVVVFDPNCKKIESEEIKYIGDYNVIEVLQNGNMAIGMDDGFVMFDKNFNKIKSSEIKKDKAYCDDIVILESGNLAVRFGDYFVMFDQNGNKIKDSEIKYSGYCYEMIPLESGNLVVCFKDELVLLDNYSFSNFTKSIIKELDLENNFNNIKQGIEDNFSEDEYGEIINFLENNLRKRIIKIDKEYSNYKKNKELQNLVVDFQELELIINNLKITQKIAENNEFDSYFKNAIATFVDKTLVEKYLKISDKKYITEASLYIKNFSVVFDNLKYFEDLMDSFNSGIYERNFIYKIIDHYIQKVSRNDADVRNLFLKLKNIKSNKLYTNFKSSLDTKYNDRDVITYIGRQKDANMPARVFLDYLENKNNLDIKETKKFIPDNAKNIFQQNKIDPVDLYILGSRGYVDDQDISKALAGNERIFKKNEINIEVIEKTREQIKKEIRGQGIEGGVYVREIFQNVGDASKKQNNKINFLKKINDVLKHGQQGELWNKIKEVVKEMKLEHDLDFGRFKEAKSYLKNISSYFKQLAEAEDIETMEVILTKLQNYLDKQIELNKKFPTNKFKISMYQENDDNIGKAYFTEQYDDNGAGIPSLVNLLVARINEKNGEDTGYFGSGFLSLFEDADVVNIKTSNGEGEIKYLTISVNKGNDGKAIGFNIDDYKKDYGDFVGTSIQRKIELDKNKIAQLEQGIVEGNILRNSSLWNVQLENGKKLELYVNNQKIEKQGLIMQEDYFVSNGEKYKIKLEKGKFSQVAHGDGLRMNDLDDKYLELVPQQIIDIFEEFNISIVLDGKLPLIKDRSSLSEENKYIKNIQKTIAKSSLKIVVKELLRNKRKFLGWSDDYFSERGYHFSYDNEDGDKIIKLANDINQNNETQELDWKYINDTEGDMSSKLARLAVLIEVDYKEKNDKNKSIMTSLASLRNLLLTKTARETSNRELMEMAERERQMFGDIIGDNYDDISNKIRLNLKHSEDISKLDYRDEVEIDIKDLDDIGQKRFKFLSKIVEKKYKDQIEMGVIESINSAGLFLKNKIGKDTFFISKEILLEYFPMTIETCVHELAHYEEGSENHEYNFTHQVNGAFGKEYKRVANLLLSSI